MSYIDIMTWGVGNENCMRTASGIAFNMVQPTIEMINIYDIAHALSNQCRFTGHTKEFYSVAQHSVFVAENVHEYPLEGLLHDATEAYISDIHRPAKRLLPEYLSIEDNIAKVIADKFSLVYPWPEEVMEQDDHMLRMEWEWLIEGQSKYQYNYTWTPQQAYKEFMRVFSQLSTF